MKEAIEREFNPRVSVPDTEPYMQRGLDQSNKTYAKYSHQANIKYGTGALATIDYFAGNQTDKPLFVFIHGGFWRGRDKTDFAYVANSILPLGCSVALMNYDLCPTVTVAQIAQQIRDGLVWLNGQSASLGFKRGLWVAGHSAGAHLIAATLAKTGQSFQLPENIIERAYLISGIYECTPVLDISVNEEIKMKPEDVAAVSPMRFPMPTEVIYDVSAGGAEPPGWVKQSTDFAEHLQKQGCKVTTHIRPDLNHYSIMQEFEQSTGYSPQLVKQALGS